MPNNYRHASIVKVIYDIQKQQAKERVVDLIFLNPSFSLFPQLHLFAS